MQDTKDENEVQGYDREENRQENLAIPLFDLE